MNIIGRWLESTPKLVGILDDPSRISSGERTMDIVYSLYLPYKNTLYNNHEWVNIIDVENCKLSTEDKDIVRYAAINI
jgi:hypothetical protein